MIFFVLQILILWGKMIIINNLLEKSNLEDSSQSITQLITTNF